MEEKKTIQFKKEEFSAREYLKKTIGKGKVSRVRIEYTPVGEKVIISTHKPGLIIGRGGEKINELTKTLKDNFDLQNPHVEIDEIKQPEFDAQLIADEIAMGMEKFGPMKFKVLAYKSLEKIMKAGALGAEIRLSGKLPSARARSWRFSQGYLKKTGESADVVDRAQARAETRPGTVGIKVSILPPNVRLKDKISLNEEVINKLKERASSDLDALEDNKKSKKKKTKKKSKK
ncbi:MAG: 30S ribosomal protein S3 [Candidatus Pacearchaeota archaeon]